MCTRQLNAGSCCRLGAQLRGACAELDAAAVSQLLLAGADAGAPDSDGHTPAHALAAAAKGAQAASVAGLIVNMLLQHGGKVRKLVRNSCLVSTHRLRSEPEIHACGQPHGVDRQHGGQLRAQVGL